MDRRVLVVGSGGREHALCWRLSQDARSMAGGAELILVAPGNPGMTDVARTDPIGVADVAGLTELVRREAIELVIIGPEAPLVEGLADTLRVHGCGCGRSGCVGGTPGGQQVVLPGDRGGRRGAHRGGCHVR